VEIRKLSSQFTEHLGEVILAGGVFINHISNGRAVELTESSRIDIPRIDTVYPPECWYASVMKKSGVLPVLWR
jgi:hypothetical protein